MNEQNGFDFEGFKAEAIKGMYAGRPLNGEKGIFAPLLKHFLESALEGKLDVHLQEEKEAGIANRRNGKASKKPNRTLYVSHGTELNVIDLKTETVKATISNMQGVHGIAVDNELNKGFISDGKADEAVVFT